MIPSAFGGRPPSTAAAPSPPACSSSRRQEQRPPTFTAPATLTHRRRAHPHCRRCRRRRRRRRQTLRLWLATQPASLGARRTCTARAWWGKAGREVWRRGRHCSGRAMCTESGAAAATLRLAAAPASPACWSVCAASSEETMAPSIRNMRLAQHPTMSAVRVAVRDGRSAGVDVGDMTHAMCKIPRRSLSDTRRRRSTAARGHTHRTHTRGRNVACTQCPLCSNLSCLKATTVQYGIVAISHTH